MNDKGPTLITPVFTDENIITITVDIKIDFLKLSNSIRNFMTDNYKFLEIFLLKTLHPQYRLQDF